MKDRENKQIVTKSNQLNEARYRLTITEQRLILTMVAMIQPDDEDFQPYRIKISDFLELIDIKNQQVYSEAKKITKGLMEKVLTIEKENSCLQISWFSSAEYFDGQGYVELCFDPKLKPYLLRIKQCFVSYQLRNVIRLKSSYSVRVYELLKQYEKIGVRHFLVKDLREILGILPTEYKKYNNFKKDILLIAQREINNNTDIIFEFKEIKTARKITELEFLIKTKPKIKEKPSVVVNISPEELENLDDYEKKLFDRLLGYFQLSREQALEVLNVLLVNNGKEWVEARLAYCKEYYDDECQKDKKCKIGALTYKALSEDWQVGNSLFDEERKEKEEAEQIKKQEAVKRDLSEKEKQKALDLKVQEVIGGLSAQELEKDFIYWVSKHKSWNFFYHLKYRRGMLAPEVQEKFKIPLAAYVQEKFAPLFEGILTALC
ncbi:DNA replication protein [Candidatus Magnetoovum chiemensis]|nr:DNA replication protein [Candidatus Magnetoovum chiemensis]